MFASPHFTLFLSFLFIVIFFFFFFLFLVIPEDASQADVFVIIRSNIPSCWPRWKRRLAVAVCIHFEVCVTGPSILYQSLLLLIITWHGPDPFYQSLLRMMTSTWPCKGWGSGSGAWRRKKWLKETERVGGSRTFLALCHSHCWLSLLVTNSGSPPRRQLAVSFCGHCFKRMLTKEGTIYDIMTIEHVA